MLLKKKIYLALKKKPIWLQTPGMAKQCLNEEICSGMSFHTSIEAFKFLNSINHQKKSEQNLENQSCIHK